MKPVIGVIGNGFVGDAVVHGFRSKIGAVVQVYDKDEKRSEHRFVDVACCDFVFICVPTPTDERTGNMDLTIMDDVMSGLRQMRSAHQPVGTIVVKSTVLPRVVNEYRTVYPCLRFLSNPEFLTERSARHDFLNPARVVLGTDDGNDVYVDELVSLYRRLTCAPILVCSHDEAALIKYASNCFFATKISFFNEINQICGKLYSSYDVVRNGVLDSDWVHWMHTQVPGPDGDLGFGGKCFPKDLRALARFAETVEVSPDVMRGALAKNVDVRTDRNWDNIKGAFTCD